MPLGAWLSGGLVLFPIDRDRIPGLGSDLGWTGVRFLPSDL